MSKYPEQVRKDAQEAAQIIRQRGWCQGMYANADGACCALGARNAVVWGEPDPDTRSHDIPRREVTDRAKALRIAIENEADTDDVADWNDDPGRTKEEVLEVFDRIANS